MKRLLEFGLYLGLLLFWFCSSSQAQDTLLTVQGENLPVKLLQVRETENKVLYFVSEADTVPKQIPLTSIFLIKFGNGDTQAYPAHLERQAMGKYQGDPGKKRKREQLQQLGTSDATTHYSGVSAGITTGAITLLNPLAGLIATGAISASRVNPNSAPHSEYLTEPSYKHAYMAEGKRKKKRAAFLGFGIGTLPWLLLFL